jgi:hypothetical protein
VLLPQVLAPPAQVPVQEAEGIAAPAQEVLAWLLEAWVAVLWEVFRPAREVQAVLVVPRVLWAAVAGTEVAQNLEKATLVAVAAGHCHYFQSLLAGLEEA